MTTSLWLVAALGCAQAGPATAIVSETPPTAARIRAEDASTPRPATSRIVAVTVYLGQALVTREVSVPEGDGAVELVVGPLPAQAIDGSLFAEGTDGLRVLSTRFRTRAVRDDTRQEVRSKEELLRKAKVDSERLEKEIAVQEQDLRYLLKLEAFTGTALTGLTEKGRLDSEAVLSLSRFVMESRAAKTQAETGLRQRLRAGSEAAEFVRRQLAELSAGSSRVERDALIVVQKARREAGAVRLGYLVGSADWRPQYRLRGGADDAPVRLEYLAAVSQQTGEDWPDVRVTLSTARPSLDAAPPELLPLKMAVADADSPGPVEAQDERSQRVVAELGKLLAMSFPNPTPLEDVLKYIRSNTQGPAFPEGVPIYVDPVGLQEVERTTSSTVVIDLAHVPLRTSLGLLLKQLGLAYRVKDGLLTISSFGAFDRPDEDDVAFSRGRGAGGMGAGMGMAPEPAASGAMLNREAASDQAEELRVGDGPMPAPTPAEKDGPGVTFAVAGRLDIPSRRDPQLLEVARIDLPAEYYAKAVPVLTPRVYRLARLTNRSELVLLPGEAAVYVGGDFVGRMRLPLVAAGEPFVGGFGVDPQVQVSRRLVRKSRSVQGGNQVFAYEFRIGLRNYRPGPVKVQLWDRLPRPQGEAVGVNLVKVSADLSNDPLYQRTARLDNLLRWDVEVPRGMVGEKALYLNYEFRLEYSRELPQPRFESGGLREGPIGGGALGGMGGMGGFRSTNPDADRRP